MSSGPSNRRRQRKAPEVPKLPDVILRTESQGDLADPGLVVAEVEARVAVSARPNTNCSKRTRANQFHQEADQLVYKGDYESALVLYHKAERLCPREHKHAVAAWRIQAAITSAANPSQKLWNQLREARSPGQESAILLAEVAARRAADVVAQSSNPIRDIPSVVRFFDSRKDFCRLASPSASPRKNRSKLMLKQLNKCMTSSFKDLETAYEAGDTAAVHELGDILMNLATMSEEPTRNQLSLYAHLVSRQITLRRHDRAVNLAVKMMFLARTSGNVLWITEALVTIGKVHLAFEHLDALAKVWERFIPEICLEPIAQAWLYHDIGRCHLELGDFNRALEMAGRCLERAEYANSKKWLIRGYLLTGQSLLKLNFFDKAVDSLRTVAVLAVEEKQDKHDAERQHSIILYVQDLIDQLTCVLKKLNEENNNRALKQKTSNDLEDELNSVVDSLDEINELEHNDNNALDELHRKLLMNELSLSKLRKRQHRDRKHFAKDEDTSDEENVMMLFNKIHAFPPVESLLLTTRTEDKSGEDPWETAGTSSKLLSLEDIQAEGEDAADVDVNLSSSRTRILHRGESGRNSDDEKTLKDDELLPLDNILGIDDMLEEDFTSARVDDEEFSDIDKAEAVESGVDSFNTSRTAHSDVSEEVTEKSVSYFSPEEGLASPSLSFSLNSESEQLASTTSKTQGKFNLGMSNYLRILKSHDFEQLRREECKFFKEREAK